MSERGAIGGSGYSTGEKFNYNTPAVQIGNVVKDGDDFVLMVRSRQSDGFQIWSSTDKTATPAMAQQALRELDLVHT